tara:strand:+ start:2014 stop:2211 length:198 start_codon:yes stop_codon:yes gene_type:complete
MTKATPTTITRPLTKKAIKSVLKEMKKDAIVKVPPYSKLCDRCLRNLFRRLQKLESERLKKITNN